MEFERAAVDLVGAGLGNDGDRRSARHPLLGVRGRGGDVHGVDHLFRNDIAGMVRQPKIDAGSTIDACGVIVPVCSVDIGGE